MVEVLQAPCRGIPSDTIEEANKIQKQMIIDAIMYALDEDGHTGDWKIKFANDYYEKKFKK
jgi:hypothetical protein